jgi:hypothetical protein
MFTQSIGAHPAPGESEMNYTRSTTASRRAARTESTRYLHVSCAAYMQKDPTARDRMIPFTGVGTTYNIGRNAAKRAKRKAARGNAA